MCGITGVYNLKGTPLAKGLVGKMLRAIAHRGPDKEKVYEGACIGLGHCRLSIIDLSAAADQPMSTPDGRFTIVYNGEIYNFADIKCQLQKLGHIFKSRTDSEVVLYAYAQWKEKCLEHFNGMFAFAVWDKVSCELFIARDRYGIKPIYYAIKENVFVFASEQKAILEHPSIGRDIDLEALLEYFTFQNILTDKTLLKGINLFPAGCWAKLAPGTFSGRLNLHRYWDYDFSQPADPLSDEAYLEELDRLFQQAVKRQLASDVEIGSYLSGGIDSGSITAVAASSLPYIKTFTCGFDLTSASGLELAFDERKKAEQLSDLFKTEHYEIVLKSGDMERVMPQLAWSLEEPRVGQSYPNYYVAKLAAKFTKVVLSGSGGDEMFAGYPWRYYRGGEPEDFENFIDKYYLFWQRLIPNRLVQAVFGPIWDSVKNVWTRDIFRDVFRTHQQTLNGPEDFINHSLYFEARTFLHGLLIVEDKLSMAHGLETRVPFLDNDLVDFAMKVPLRLKLKDLRHIDKLNENEIGPKKGKYFEKTGDGKLLLRKVMERYVPKEITTRQKQGFCAPDASWFKGESIDYVRRILYNDNSRLYSFLDKKSVQGLITEHLEAKQNRRLFIWSLLNFEWWCRKFLI